MDESQIEPLVKIRGRGTAWNPPNRFEPIDFVPDWDVLDPDEPGPRTTVRYGRRGACYAKLKTSASTSSTISTTIARRPPPIPVRLAGGGSSPEVFDSFPLTFPDR